MPQTNMDNQKNPTATAPVLEFSIPDNEVEEGLKVGDKGELIIPVEVVSKGDGITTYRKSGAAKSERRFREESITEMRDRIGVVKETER